MTTTTSITQPWAAWRRHFEDNARRPLPRPPRDLERIPPAQRAALLRSLARFQLGEAGEGRIAHEIDRVTLAGIDDDYRAALKRFVKEEGRHARVLADIVRAMGGQLLKRHWTDRLFVGGRRLAGVQLKLVVLLAAEVIGIEFYGQVVEALPPCELAARLDEIRGDEIMHLEFHADFFRARVRGPGERLVFTLLWWLVAGAAAAVVVLDHGPCVRALGRSRLGLARGLLARAAASARAVLAEPRATRAGRRRSAQGPTTAFAECAPARVPPRAA